MSTGQARRASVLTSACLRASGALQFATANSSIWGIHLARLGKSTPRHSAILKSNLRPYNRFCVDRIKSCAS